MSTPRVRLPRTAREGEEIEIRTLISHPMVTGVGPGDTRNMLTRFTALMNGDTVLQYDFGNGSAANPTFAFHVRVAAPGAFAFIWRQEDGTEFSTEQSVSVS